MARLSHLKRIARSGGLARIKKHGNPGTADGRRKGGIRSFESHQKLATRFKLLKKISFPPRSAELAELIGIFMGDGHVGTYQASVCTNVETDLQHAQYVRRLITSLFGVSAALHVRKDCKVCVVVVSSKQFCNFLRSQGLIHGNKVHGGVSIPRWIYSRRMYRRAFVRGLFDTDGCAYIDHHLRKGKMYQYMSLAFTNRNLDLLEAFKGILMAEGMHPTQKTKYAVFLRREADIRRYFSVIGSSNQKHRSRLQPLLHG